VFKVVRLDVDDKTYCHKILFRTYLIEDCFKYICSLNDVNDIYILDSFDMIVTNDFRKVA
jgi:hypothetical protein